jgi:hypothetical protein
MAWRGTDIKLSPEVEQRSGLHVILTEFHERASTGNSSSAPPGKGIPVRPRPSSAGKTNSSGASSRPGRDRGLAMDPETLRLHGYLLKDPRCLFDDVPPDNPYLTCQARAGA